MRHVVADASVVVKWALPTRDDEPDHERALELLQAVRGDHVRLHQPPHWLAEVGAVLTRLTPATAEEDIADLHGLELPVVESREVYLLASRLAKETGQHLFDTLYHAVALSLDAACLVTADERYYRGTAHYGAVEPLSGFRV